MNKSSINSIEKEYKNIVLGLDFEEIKGVYKHLTNEIIDCYPSHNKRFFDDKKLIELNNSHEELTNVLLEKYPKIDVTWLSYRAMALTDKYLKEIELSQYKLLALGFLDIVSSLCDHIEMVSTILSCIYYEHSHSLWIPDENKSRTYSINYDRLIRIHMTLIKKYLPLVEPYSRIDKENVVTYFPDDNEEVLKIIDYYNKVYDMCEKYLKKYNTFLENPFYETIEHNVECDKEFLGLTEEEASKKLEKSLKDAPSYDFNNFEIIRSPTLETTIGR